MKILKLVPTRFITISLFPLFAIIHSDVIRAQQHLSFGIHVDPVISWFSTDIKEIKNEGSRPGFNFGLSYNRYFSDNYSFSTGISLLTAGGRLVSQDTIVLEFSNSKYKTTKVLPNESVVYKIQYLVIPIGLKLQTDQIGYLTFFSDIGFDPKVVVGGKASIPSLKISGETATNQLRMVNLSYHISAGIEYSLGGTTAIVLGLNFDNNFLDITKDQRGKPADKVSHKIMSFRLGVNF